MVQLMQQMCKQQETLMKIMEQLSTSSSRVDTHEVVIDRLQRRLERYTHDPEQGGHFEFWLRRFDDALNEYPNLPEDSKTHLLVSLLDSHIMPRKPGDLPTPSLWSEKDPLQTKI